jgi:hypothetical protein
MPTEKLSTKQQRFTTMLGHFLCWIASHPGWGVTMGEGHRPGWVAQEYARQGKGIVNSNHCRRLAVDLMFFRNGTYQTDPAAYLPLGEYWESLGGAWGGRFPNRDAVHFSLEHNGVK